MVVSRKSRSQKPLGRVDIIQYEFIVPQYQPVYKQRNPQSQSTSRQRTPQSSWSAPSSSSSKSLSPSKIGYTHTGPKLQSYFAKKKSPSRKRKKSPMHKRRKSSPLHVKYKKTTSSPKRKTKNN